MAANDDAHSGIRSRRSTWLGGPCGCEPKTLSASASASVELFSSCYIGRSIHQRASGERIADFWEMHVTRRKRAIFGRKVDFFRLAFLLSLIIITVVDDHTQTDQRCYPTHNHDTSS